MAKTTNTKASMFLNMVLIVSLVLIIAMAEGRSVHGIGFQKAESTLDCESVVSVKSGDTCLDIAKTFKLTPEFFGLINPNLNCNALFVGQWLCVDGTA